MKLFDETNLDLDMLESLGIYVLRDIGRKVGVKLPTTLKKAELIKQIRAIKSGEQLPYEQKTKKGRPPKTLSSVDDLVDAYFQNSEKDDELSDGDFEYIKVCESDLNPCSYDRVATDEILIKGVFDISGGGGVIVDVPSKVCFVTLTNKEVKQFNLKKGDYVECLVRWQEKNKPYKLARVLSVNFKLPNHERIDFLNSEEVLKTSKLDFVAGGNYNSIENNLMDCFFGDRIIITGMQRNQIDYCVTNLLNNNKDKARVVSLLVDSTKEQVEDYKKISKNVVFASYCGDFYSSHVKTTFLASEHVLRLCESGEKNVVLVIPNLNALVNALCRDKEDYYEVIRKLKQVFMFARQTEQSSLTIILGVLSGSEVYSNFEGCENVRLLIHENLITNMVRFKYDILNSQRADLNYELSDVRRCVCDYLIKHKNSYESIRFIDALMFECNSIEEFVSKINANN